MGLIVRFDNVSARIGKSKAYKRAYWWYKTQDTYFSNGLGKLFLPLQFTALTGNIGLVFIVVEKFIPLPKIVYALTIPFVFVLVISSNLLGRFLDKSYSTELENEWGVQRNPFAKEVRKRLKIRPKYAVHKKNY